MSTEREYEAGAFGVHGAGGAPGVRPNVYQPQPAPAPAYEEYADPAMAHGWQNAYDETRELPALSGAGTEAAESESEETVWESAATAGGTARRWPPPGRGRRRNPGRGRGRCRGGVRRPGRFGHPG
ncbi:hypothetical protein ACFFMQ_18445, partial [Streptomyces actinomycinicus]